MNQNWEEQYYDPIFSGNYNPFCDHQIDAKEFEKNKKTIFFTVSIIEVKNFWEELVMV